MASIREIEIEKVDFSNKKYTFRHSFNVDDLTNSIKYEGLLYLPTVIDDNSGFVIVSGYRRLLACKKLDMETVKCTVYHTDELSREEFLKMSIAENTKRKNLKPVEIAEALQRIKEELNLNTEELAGQFGDTFEIGNKEEEIDRYLKLNLLDNESKDFFAESKSDNVEFEITGLDKSEDRKALLDLVKSNTKIKKNQLHKIIENVNAIKKKEPEAEFSSVFNDNSVKEIIQDDTLNGTKKISAIMAEIEKRADPEKIEKISVFNGLHQKFKTELKEAHPDWERKIDIKKQKFGEHAARIIIDFNNVNEFLEMMKYLYDLRKSIISPVLKL